MRPDSQCARVLRVLADGEWHTVPSIHRKAGTMRLNSRVAELRKAGATIECDRNGRGKGAGAYRYRLTAMSGPLITRLPEPLLRAWTDDENGSQASQDDDSGAFVVPGDNYAPRDERNRYRLYRLVADDLQLVATCESPEAVGVALVTLGAEQEFERACVGLLDTGGADEKPGRWILNAYDGDARW